MAKTCCICMSEIEICRFRGSLINAIIERFHNCDEKCQFLVLNCHHYFHYDCLEEWFNIKPICPMCRDESVYILPYCRYMRYRRFSCSVMGRNNLY